MQIIFICSSEVLAFPSVKYLYDNGMLAAIVFPPKAAAELKKLLKHYNIPADFIYVFDKDGLAEGLETLIKTTGADAVFVFAYPYKIPAEVLKLPKHGFLNFHPGMLPAYKGADPVFWQIKNGESQGGIVVHEMTEVLDEGPVVVKETLPLIPGETYGLHFQRLAQLAVSIVVKLLQLLPDSDDMQQQETSLPSDTSNFLKRPSTQDLTINWQTQTAAQIESLVNATNPNYGGAITTIRQVEICILEVSPADINNPPHIKAGTIVHADVVYGLIVACINKEFLKINVVRLKEGYMSGIKLYNLGFKVGEMFL